jgi:hypothetical protein
MKIGVNGAFTGYASFPRVFIPRTVPNYKDNQFLCLLPPQQLI